MDPVRTIARASLGAVFISGGIDSLRSPAPKAKVAAPVIAKAHQAIGILPAGDVTLVRINAGVDVAAGSLLVMGKLPRLSALALAGSLLLTTLGGHRFWEADTDEAKAQQQLHFTKNLAMFGGLLFAALDRHGEPSLAWRARGYFMPLPVLITMTTSRESIHPDSRSWATAANATPVSGQTNSPWV
jgi:putative oxidoreductase